MSSFCDIKLAILRAISCSQSSSAIWLAVSGGLDSCVLMDACYRYREELGDVEVRVVHIDHGLQECSVEFASLVEKQAKQYNFPYHIFSLKLQVPIGESLEAYARKARYKAFSELLSANDSLWTAHHSLDQAETFLLQAFRGSGLMGLVGMPKQQKLGDGIHIRPLIGVSKETLEIYAKQHNICYINDPSNNCTNFRRNHLRHRIWPRLKEQWHDLEATINRSQMHLQADYAWLQEEANALKKRCVGSRPNSLSVSLSKDLGSHRCSWVFKLWLQELGVSQLSTKRWLSMWQDIFNSKAKQGKVVLENKILYRYQDDLLCLSKHDWPVSKLDLDNDYLQFIKSNNDNIKLLNNWGSIIWERPATSSTTNNNTHSLNDFAIIKTAYAHSLSNSVNDVSLLPKSFKKRWQSLGVPPWLRRHWPVIMSKDGSVLSVCGLWAVNSAWRCRWVPGLDDYRVLVDDIIDSGR